MIQIKDIIRHSEHTAEVVIESPSIAASARAGHFVIIRFNEECPRIPFTIVDTDKDNGTFTIIIHKGARLTELINSLEVGYEILDLLGPLGQAFEVKNYGKVLCCGDGAGFVPLIPIIKALKKTGNNVTAILSEFSEKTSCLKSNAEKYADEILLSEDESETLCIIDDFTSTKGVDLVIMTGPTHMMKKISEITMANHTSTLCILNMVMLDGVGLCGICRVMVDGVRKLTCIDGPIFDAHHVDFDQLQNRQSYFL
ncbi:MAG: sulfide/dihydroorotate dehydrogenase-like FAD/NAD-binding protein [Duncaniella sp.]|nr:sulfide/dihydroorotate dehydrogenase-like FAD/NAD-binding protein [Muribaculum sp.]MCM1255741.1 sulfide/dihydroorotate dehydrogenase-like FAD/NAD-binding protein [Duncaniella sp.]